MIDLFSSHIKKKKTKQKRSMKENNKYFKRNYLVKNLIFKRKKMKSYRNCIRTENNLNCYKIKNKIYEDNNNNNDKNIKAITI